MTCVWRACVIVRMTTGLRGERSYYYATVPVVTYLMMKTGNYMFKDVHTYDLWGLEHFNA